MLAWLAARSAKLLSVAALGMAMGCAAQAEPIRGAGSTFAAPVIAEWARDYKNARADGGDFFTLDWTVDYERVGSLAGLMRLDQPEMDFAATDAPVPPAELARKGRQQFPIVMGAIAVSANLEGVGAASLRLSGPVLADIYLGRITVWSDPAIGALNPGIALPDRPIAVLHRKDGSGSTFVFTEFLSAASADWKAGPGADTLIAWPVGNGFEGTPALLAAVASTPGAIAYAEFGQVQRAGLAHASIQNSAGQFIAPGAAGVEAAAAAVDWAGAKDFYASLTNRPGAAAYPISTATFAVVPFQDRPERARRVHDLFRLAFGEGAEQARALGFVPLPRELVTQVEAYWSKGLPVGN